MSGRRVRAAAAFSIAALCVAGAAALGTWLWWCSQSAATPPDPARPEAADADGFPAVDWGYWTAVNPDVVGWVSVPGTDISSAIVQAPADDPTYYLHHDIHRVPNHLGCPYLDAACAEEGFDSANAVVFGHHIKHGSPQFATFARYGDGAFARQHSVILLQTPQWKRMLTVAGAAIVCGYDRTKQTAFADAGAFRAWYADRMAERCVALDDRVPERCTTFVTCSYTRYKDERTLVYGI